MKTKKIIITLCLIIVAAAVLSDPKSAASGAYDGLMLCGRVTVPALFPMTFLTVVLCKLVGGGVFSVWIMSLISGYPVGARLLKSRVDSGDINCLTAKTAVLFCVNAGPAFIVSAVGTSCLKSPIIGWVMLAAHIFGSTVVFAVFGLKLNFSCPIRLRDTDFCDSCIEAAYEAANSMLQICGFIILFSSFTEMVKNGILPEAVKTFIISTAEISKTVTLIRSPVLLSFFLGFGGFCVHLQVWSAGKSIRPKYLTFLAARLIHGISSALFCELVLKAFPITLPASTIALSSQSKNSIPAFVSLAITAVIFVLSAKNYRKEWKSDKKSAIIIKKSETECCYGKTVR